MRRCTLAALALVVAGFVPARAEAPDRTEVPITLRGSLLAMERQHGIALDAHYPFARTPGDLVILAEQGALIRLDGNDDYELGPAVQSPLARPAMRTFIEHLAADYHEACGEKLVVTSLTRPVTRQPPNAHRLSVHPAGIAVDLRVSRDAHCRRWLERTLLGMEEAVLLDVTREYNPPHYHVALFPHAYMNDLVARIDAENLRETALTPARAAWAAAWKRRRVDQRGGDRQGSRAGFLILPALGIVATGLRRKPLWAKS